MLRCRDHWDHWDAVAGVLCLRQSCFSVFPSSQVFSGLRSLGVVETHIGPATRALPTCRHSGRVGTCWNCWNHGPYRDRKWQTHHKVDQVDKPCWNFRTKVLSNFVSTGLAIHFVPFQDSNWLCPVPDPSLMVHRARPSGWTNARSSQVSMPETWKQKQEKTFFWTTLKSKHKCVKKWKLRRLRPRSSQRPVRCETAHVFSERMLKEQNTLPWLLPASVFPLHIFFRSARNPPGTRKSRGKMASSPLLWLSFNPVFLGCTDVLFCEELSLHQTTAREGPVHVLFHAALGVQFMCVSGVCLLLAEIAVVCIFSALQHGII